MERVPQVYRYGLVEYEAFRMLNQSREFLAENYDRVITLQDAAEVACLSPFHFQRQFKKAFQESPHDFISRLRIDQAKKLLAKGDLSVTEVCMEIGYESLGTFSTRFAREVGCAPSEFRRVFSIPTHWWLRNVPGCVVYRWGPPKVLQTE